MTVIKTNFGCIINAQINFFPDYSAVCAVWGGFSFGNRSLLYLEFVSR